MIPASAPKHAQLGCLCIPSLEAFRLSLARIYVDGKEAEVEQYYPQEYGAFRMRIFDGANLLPKAADVRVGPTFTPGTLSEAERAKLWGRTFFVKK